MTQETAWQTLKQAWPLIAFSLTLRPLVTSVGPVLPEIRSELSMSATQASLLTVLPVVCFAFGAFAVPRLLTRISPNTGVVVALILMAVGGHIRLAQHIPLLLIGTVICGLGAAIGNILGGIVTRRDFATKVGLVMGMYVGLMSVTSSAAAMTSFPLSQVTGSWRWSLEVWAALPILVLMSWMMYSRKHRDNARMMNRPAYRHIARNKMAWWLVLYFGFQSTNFHSLAGWLPSILRDSGIAPTDAGLMVSVMILLGVPAGFIVTPLAAKSSSQRNLVIAIIGVSLVGLIGVWQAPTLAPWLWTICLGLGVGSSFPLALTLAITKADTTDAARDLSSFMQSWGYVISAVGPFALGILHDFTGNWSIAVLALIVGTFIQLIAGLVISRPGHIHVSTT